VKPPTVIDVVQKLLDMQESIVAIAIAVEVDLLALQRSHEALRKCIIVWIASTAHADPNTVRQQQVHVFSGAVLHASICVVDQS
jgi:hypothetical protein